MSITELKEQVKELQHLRDEGWNSGVTFWEAIFDMCNKYGTEVMADVLMECGIG